MEYTSRRGKQSTDKYLSLYRNEVDSEDWRVCVQDPANDRILTNRDIEFFNCPWEKEIEIPTVK